MFLNYRCIRIGFFLIFAFLLSSCNQDKIKKTPKTEREKILKTEIKKNLEWIGQDVLFPESITPFKPNNKEITKKYTLIAYYDGNCSYCYKQLLKWIQMIKVYDVYDISFKFILSGYNGSLLKANLENIKFPLNIAYHDTKNEFSKKYHFLLDSNYTNSCMLVDNKNTILFIGNPTISEDDKSNFIKFIKD